MISSENEEELLLRWLFGEIIYRQHRGTSVENAQRWSWATNTRFHKIIFSVLEKHDIPVTRSWYMWGGYIHSDILEGDKFNYYRKRYSIKPEVVIKLREEIRKTYIPVDEIIKSVSEISAVVLSMSSKEFIPLYYKQESPKIYRTLYVSKQNLTDYFDLFSSFMPYKNYRYFLDIEEEFQKDLYSFNVSGYKLLDDDNFSETNYKFNNIIGAVLDKFKVMLFMNERMSQKKFSFFNNVNRFFKEYIWKPYASRVSQNTVKGLRATSERRIMMEREFNSIEYGKEEIDKLSLLMRGYKLEPTYQEYKILEANIKIDPKIKNLIDEMLKIYTKKEDANV